MTDRTPPIGRENHDAASEHETRTLEELVAAGEVEAALLLKGAYSRREMELVHAAWAAGIKMGKQIERAAQAAALKEAGLM